MHSLERFDDAVRNYMERRSVPREKIDTQEVSQIIAHCHMKGRSVIATAEAICRKVDPYGVGANLTP
jgi:hypothetical protein